MILVWLILIPFIGGLLCWQGERLGRGAPRWFALITMVIVLGLGVYLWATHDFSLAAPTPTAAAGASRWQAEFRASWIPQFGISFHLGLDGLSILMVMLTGLLGMMAVICSWSEIQRNVGFFHLNLLWNLAGVIGVFLALDLFLFFFFWEMMLVPMYFLIALWGHNAPGGKGRIYAATKFFLFTQAAGLLMLVSIIGLVTMHYLSSNQISFDYETLLNTPMKPAIEFLLMMGFFIAFAVKLPVLPLHSWLPDAHSQAPTAGSVDLAGVLLKTAAYGFLRFGVPLFPHAAHTIAPYAMWLGIAGVFYGGVLAYGQNDMKRLIAYTSVSHMGFVLVGIYAGNMLALQGVVVQMVAHGISAGGLFILSGELYERLHTRDLRQMGGLWAKLPYLPPIALAFSAASLGLPGMGNFVGEFLIMFGTFKTQPVIASAAAAGLILAAAYSLLLVQRAFFGAAKVPEGVHELHELSGRELVMLLSLLAILLGIGLYPRPVLETSVSAMTWFDHRFTPGNATADARPATATAPSTL